MTTSLIKLLLLSANAILLGSCSTHYRIRNTQTESASSSNLVIVIDSTVSFRDRPFNNITNKTDNLLMAGVSRKECISSDSPPSVTLKNARSGSAFIYHSSYKAELRKARPLTNSENCLSLQQKKIIPPDQNMLSLTALLVNLSFGITSIVLIKKSTSNY